MSPDARTATSFPKLLGGRRDVIRGRFAPLAEEDLLGFVLQQFLPLGGGQIQPVLVDDHLRELQPLLPRLERDVVVDPLPELVVEGLIGNSRELFLQLRAVDHSRHGAFDPPRRTYCEMYGMFPAMAETTSQGGRGKGRAR